MAKKRTNDEFLAIIHKISPTINVLTPYNGKDKKVTVNCGKCGYNWEVVANSLIRGMGCPKCAGNAPKTTEQFTSELKAKNDCITVVGEYKGANTKIAVVCKKCRNEWFATPSHLLNGRGCPKCSKQIVTNKRIDAFIQRCGSLADNYNELLKEWNFEENEKRGINPNLLTSKSNRIASWKCCKCGYIYDAIIANRTGRKSGCPLCASKIVLSGINDISTTAKELMREWDYEENERELIFPQQLSKGSEVLANWKCLHCGQKWKATVYSRVAGSGCPHCAKEFQTSLPEKYYIFISKKYFQKH